MMEKQQPRLSPYLHKAILGRIIDGDTIEVDLDLGMNIRIVNVMVRLVDIDAAEPSAKDEEQQKIAFHAKAHLAAMLLNREILIETYKDKTDKYGRCLSTVWTKGEDEEEWTNVNEKMVENGYAKRWE